MEAPMSKTLALGILAAALVVAITTNARAPQRTSAPSHAVTKDFEQWKKDLNNWNRWGKDDEVGTINLITPAKRKQAAALVKEGFSVSLAGDADTERAIDNPQP